MFQRNGRIAFGVAVGLLGWALDGCAASDSGVLTFPNRTFVHTESKVAVRVPAGWESQAPYRLRKTTNSTVFGLEADKKTAGNIAVTIVWSPLKRKWDEVIRATTEENRGDEYATLVTVYGKTKVDRPTTMKVGPFLVYKVMIDAGPDKNDAGALYLFEAGQGDNRWEVRVRAVFPTVNREEYLKQVEEVISNFSIAPEIIEIDKLPK